MDKLERIYNELNEAVNGKMYLLKYFDNLKSEIDLECVKVALGSGDELRAFEQQIELIEQVDLFQGECLANLERNPIGELSLEEWDQRLRNLDLKDMEAALRLEKELYCELYRRKKALFMNKGIVFLGMNEYEAVFKPYYLTVIDGQRDPGLLVGILILVNDEFLLYSDKLKMGLED